MSYRPGPRCATHHRAKKNTQRTTAHDAHVLKTYGITGDEYWAIYEAQNRVCYICQRATGARKRLSVDHDHATGEVRGLLCTTDNRYLGHIRDSIETAKRVESYLRNPPARRILGGKNG